MERSAGAAGRIAYRPVYRFGRNTAANIRSLLSQAAQMTIFNAICHHIVTTFLVCPPLFARWGAITSCRSSYLRHFAAAPSDRAYAAPLVRLLCALQVFVSGVIKSNKNGASATALRLELQPAAQRENEIRHLHCQVSDHL